LFHILDPPGTDAFRQVLRQNLIKNCPVTVEDVNLAEKIYGKDSAAIKGKDTRPKAPVLVDNDANKVDIPKELVERNHKIQLHFMQGFFPCFASGNIMLRLFAS